MELETVNKLYLELSQIVTAKTARELELEDLLRSAHKLYLELSQIVTAMYLELSQIATAKTSRELELEDLLRSAHAIAERKGADTAWERFAARCKEQGIGSVTARVYKVAPSDG